MNRADYEKCARRIIDAVQLKTGESVTLKVDKRIFTELLAPLQNLIEASGAHIEGVIPAEDTTALSF
jgi:hypothetical protein